LQDELVVIGVTHHAQEQLGDVVFLELPEVGTQLTKGKAFGVVESVKAVSDLYAPIDGEVVEVNQVLVDSPEGVNQDPYGAAWLLKLRASDSSDVDTLLDAAAYAALLKSEEK
ncbi:MAG: glycine cleavage system protein GcvH, partial [Myxococcota bacterium]